MAELTDHIALVTGAGKGLGEAAARALAAEGARVVVSDLVAPDALAEEIGGIACAHDVTQEDQWIAVMAQVRDQAGGLDILVNNAGIYLYKPLVETSLEEWRRVQSVNVEGAFLGHKHAIPLLAERAHLWRGGTAIVNLSSVAGLRGSALMTAYNASKGAVRLLTKGAAIELAPQRIRVNSIHPGIIETDMGRGLVSDFGARMGAGENEVRVALSQVHPWGSFGEPQNVADAVVFLASDRAAFTTGAELTVDGGLSTR